VKVREAFRRMRVWRAVMGQPDLDGAEEWDEEDDEDAVLSAGQLGPGAGKAAVEMPAR